MVAIRKHRWVVTSHRRHSLSIRVRGHDVRASGTTAFVGWMSVGIGGHVRFGVSRGMTTVVITSVVSVGIVKVVVAVIELIAMLAGVLVGTCIVICVVTRRRRRSELNGTKYLSCGPRSLGFD